jgi:hypothetical protein
VFCVLSFLRRRRRRPPIVAGPPAATAGATSHRLSLSVSLFGAHDSRFPRNARPTVNNNKQQTKTKQALAAAAKKYAGDPAAAASLAGSADDADATVDFAAFAAAFRKAATAPDAEQAAEVGLEAQDGSIPAVGFAARDPSGDLAPLRFRRRPLGERDVLIAITHAGICHSDLHTVRGEWGDLNASKQYPLVPGHEIVGFVVAVGPGVTKFAVGARAGVGVFVEACGECKFCAKGDQPFCSKVVFTYNGRFPATQAPSRGGYSSSITIDERYALRVPDNLPLEGVAPLREFR